MIYASVAEIEQDFKDTDFTETTLVRSQDVVQFIHEAEALINGYVGTVYEIPVSDSGLITDEEDTLTTEELEELTLGNGQGYLLLKLLTRSLVAARIKRILEVKQEKNTDPEQNIIGVLLSPSLVMKILKDIQAKNIILQGAVPLSSGGGFYSNNAANSVEPVMKKDTKLW